MRFSHLVLLGLSFAISAHAEPKRPAVSAAMQRIVDAHEVAGAVTLVTTNDRIVHLDAAGVADLQSGRPMNVDALFWIASITKPVTAVAVLMLQDDGKLKLTDPIAKYLPEAGKLQTPSGKPANITIAQLLTHTSGLAEHTREAFASPDVATLIRGCLTAPLQFEPGERWKYTTSAFDVAARIVEIVSDQPYDAFLEERLLTPLGMTSTTFFPTEAQRARLASAYALNRSTGALERRSIPVANAVRGQFPPVAGGGLFSTAADLGRFGRMLLNRGQLDGRRYLSEAAYAQFTTVQTGDLPTGFSAAQIKRVLGWGLGAYVLRSNDGPVASLLSVGAFGHPGACGTHLIIDPGKGYVYVLLIQRPNLPDNFENEPTRAFLQAVAAASDPG